MKILGCSAAVVLLVVAGCSSTAKPTGLPASPPAGYQRIRYEVFGTAKLVDLRYRAEYSTPQIPQVSLPINDLNIDVQPGDLEFDVRVDDTQEYYVYAKVVGAGAVSCKTSVNGQVRSRSTSDATTPFVICTT